MTTDQFAAFPDAPAPKTLAEAQDLIETPVRLIGKEGGRPANLPRPETLVDALDHLEAQRQVLADLLREVRRSLRPLERQKSTPPAPNCPARPRPTASYRRNSRRCAPNSRTTRKPAPPTPRKS